MKFTFDRCIDSTLQTFRQTIQVLFVVVGISFRHLCEPSHEAKPFDWIARKLGEVLRQHLPGSRLVLGYVQLKILSTIGHPIHKLVKSLIWIQE